MPVISANNFSLHHTITSGQMFRFTQQDEWFYIQTGWRLFRAKQRGNRLIYDGDADEAFLRHFFSLDHSLDLILSKIAVDDHVAEATRRFPGLRILRQDPWECLVSFLCSAAANIPKIKDTVNAICRAFGRCVELHDVKSWTFPPLGALSNSETLRSAKAGFRADYIARVNARLAQEPRHYLESLQRLPYTEAKERLEELPGVGPKVADCVMLFALGFLQAFPVDTWIRRTMRKFYFNNQPVSEEKIREFAQTYFGDYAGYAQQYLYHQSRHSQEASP